MKLDSGIIQPLYEDNHLLAIGKPAGYLVQGDKTNDPPLIELAKKYVKVKYQKPGNVFLGLAHRLDRPVSGALLLARTSKALTRLNKMFANQEISKRYLAITSQAPRDHQGVLREWLIKDRNKNVVKGYSSSSKGGKEALTSYRVVGQVNSHYLIEIEPRTGRSHQIRVAMKTLGSPIVGDVKYQGDKWDPKFIFLHCLSMEFKHPVGGKPMKILAPLPSDTLWQSFKQNVPY